MTVSVKSNETGRAVTELLLDRRTARKLKLATRLARRTTNVAAGRRAKVTLKLSAKTKAKLRRLRAVRLTVQTTVRDGAGNRSVRRKTLVFKR